MRSDSKLYEAFDPMMIAFRDSQNIIAKLQAISLHRMHRLAVCIDRTRATLVETLLQSARRAAFQ